MIIYLAAPWARREEARAAREQFLDAGITVQSRWLDFKSGPDVPPDAVLNQEAHNDIADINACDALVVLNLEKSEGKSFEQGYAYALGTPVIVVGEPSNVFHYLENITVVGTVDEAIAYLRSAFGPYQRDSRLDSPPAILGDMDVDVSQSRL